MRGSLRAIAFGAMLVGLWAAASEAARSTLLPGPLAVGGALLHGLRDGSFVRAVATSGLRLALGYAAALGTGVPVGVAIARGPLGKQASGPVVLGLSAVPSICWLPVAIHQ